MTDRDRIDKAIKKMSKTRHPFFIVGVLESIIYRDLTDAQKAEVAERLEEISNEKI